MRTLIPAAAALFLAPPALLLQRQEILELSADIINLEQQVREVQRTLDERNSELQSLVEQTFDRVTGVTDALDGMVATVDEIRASNDRLSGELRIEIGNIAANVERVDRTLVGMQADVAAVSQQMIAFSATTEDLAAPENLLREAQVDLFTGNFELARDGFQEYLFLYPDSPDAPLAQMRIGDAYYDEGDYERAILEYDFVLQKYPGSDRIPDALLKKGLALLASDMEPEARDVLEQLAATFPDSTQGTRAREELDALGD